MPQNQSLEEDYDILFTPQSPPLDDEDSDGPVEITENEVQLFMTREECERTNALYLNEKAIRGALYFTSIGEAGKNRELQREMGHQNRLRSTGQIYCASE